MRKWIPCCSLDKEEGKKMRKKRNEAFILIKQYGIKSVFFKYIVSSLAISMVIFTTFSVAIYLYYGYVRTNDLSTQATINVLQSKNLFESITSEFRTNYKLTEHSDAVEAFLDMEEAGAAEIFQVQEFLTEMMKNSELIEEAYLYSLSNKICVSTQETKKIGMDYHYEWIRTYRGTRMPFLMFPRKDESGKFRKLYICNEISDGMDAKGVFCIEMNYEKFAEIVQNSFVRRPQSIYVVSDLGLILYADDPKQINKLMFERQDTYTAFQNAQNSEGSSILYGDYIIAVARSTQFQLMIMSYISRYGYLESNPFIKILLIGSFAAAMLLSLVLSLFFSFWQYRSVSNVMDILTNPTKLHKENGPINEFFYIANSISDISSQKEFMKSELSEKMYELKSAQIAALQTQINPHFLFNTLQLINLSIIRELKKDNTATFLVSQLATLLRASYDTENYLVSVEEEFRIAQLYLNIQQTRYHSQLQVYLDISEECRTIKTVKLILQPLLENAFLHGFKGMESEWILSVSCWIQNGYLEYRIVDNGAGMEKEPLRQLQQSLQEDKIDRNERIGVSNVNQRLKLVFGRDCYMRIESQKNRGTTVVLGHIINKDL